MQEMLQDMASKEDVYMGNIIDYVREHGNISFVEEPLNEVDSLVLCQMVYMNLGRFVPGLDEHNHPVHLQDIYNHPDRDHLLDDYWYKGFNKELIEAMAQSKRFGSLKLNGYVNVIDVEDETQFSAVTYILEDKSVYIAYRGTDATIIGWKEDMNLAFSKPLSSQHLAVAYMDKMASWIAGDFYAGGHSKGGNLAVYAAMNCAGKTREKLLHIYNNDGPGFRAEIRAQGHFDLVRDRISKFIPRSSIVGMILEDHSDYEIVESYGIGMLQHNAYSWKIDGTHFVRAQNMSSGKIIRDGSLNEWILSLSDEEKHIFIDTLYDVISASEASNIFEFGADIKKSLQHVFEAAKEVDEPTRKAIMKIMKSLVEITAQNFMASKMP